MNTDVVHSRQPDVLSTAALTARLTPASALVRAQARIGAGWLRQLPAAAAMLVAVLLYRLILSWIDSRLLALVATTALMLLVVTPLLSFAPARR